jgi:RNA polymerase sigma factor (sigma-70 family)
MYQKTFFRRLVSLPADWLRRKIGGTMPRGGTIASDTELVTRIGQSDEAAEAALYEKYSSRVYFLALSELHSRDDAEDVRAETFLRVIQALRQDKLRKPEALAAFLVGIALNIIREHNRRGANLQPLAEEEYELADDHSLESAFLDTEVNQALEEAAESLKPRERDFLRMYYYEEMSKEEISRALGIQEDRLRLLKSRTLKKFGEMYKKLAGK